MLAAGGCTGGIRALQGHGAWRRVRGLPLIVRALVWLLFLPVLVGLWVWRTAWPLAGRLVTIGGLAGWSLLIFIPQPG